MAATLISKNNDSAREEGEQPQGPTQFRAIRAPTAFDLCKFCLDEPVATVEIIGDCSALCLQAEAKTGCAFMPWMGP